MHNTAPHHAVSCDANCPVRKASQIIDGKWTTLIVRDLLGGTKRYSELLRSIDRISPKMLASRLEFLQRKGIVAKKTYPTVPPTTEYRLTARGKELRGVIEALSRFGHRL